MIGIMEEMIGIMEKRKNRTRGIESVGRMARQVRLWNSIGFTWRR